MKQLQLKLRHTQRVSYVAPIHDVHATVHLPPVTHDKVDGHGFTIHDTVWTHPFHDTALERADTCIGTRQAQRSRLIHRETKTSEQLKLRHTQRVDTCIGTVPSLTRRARGCRLIHTGTRIKADKAQCKKRAAAYLLHAPARRRLERVTTKK